MARNGREEVAARFDRQDIAARLIAFYEQHVQR